jgi:hypothetical protein
VTARTTTTARARSSFHAFTVGTSSESCQAGDINGTSDERRGSTVGAVDG